MNVKPGGSTTGGNASSAYGRERSRSVLIVDGDALVAMLIAEIIADSLEGVADFLEGLDCEVRGISAPGAQALAALHRPRVAIVDIGVKGTMDGVETAAQLRERLGTKCMLCSGDIGAATEERAAYVAPAAILSNPFTSAQFEAVLARTLAATG